MQSDVRKVTYGASMVALVGVLLWLNRYTAGIVEFYFPFILSLPLVLYTGKYGLKEAMTPFIAVMIITFVFFFNTPTTIFITVNACLTGMAYGWGVHTKKSGNQLFFITVFFTGLSYLVTTYLFAGFFGYNIQEDINLIVELFQDAELGIPFGLNMEDFIRMIYPAVIILSAFLEAFVIHSISFVLLKRLRYPVDHLKKLIDITIPKWVGLILLVLAFSEFLVPVLNDSRWISVVFAVSTLSLMLFLINGFVFIVWYIRNFGKRNDILLFYLSVFMLMIFATSILIFGLVIVGAADMCVNIKDWLRNRSSNVKEN